MKRAIKTAMQELEEYYADTARKIQTYGPEIHALVRATELFPDLVARKQYGDRDFDIDIGWQDNTVKGPRIRVKELENFADVLPLLEFLDANGFECKGSDDYAELGRRTYQCGRISVMCFVANAAEGCHRVQCGTEPVYKLVCQ